MHKGRFAALDGMRGVCALIVVVYHCDNVLNSGTLLNHGWLSVDVFFILSGFVIGLVYETRLSAQRGFVAFVRGRIRRLVPTQIVGTLIAGVSALVVSIFGEHQVGGLTVGFICLATIASALLIPIGGASYTPYPVNPPLWSLLGEWIVNILYGGVLYAANTRLLAVIVAILVAYMLAHSWNSLHGWDATVPYELMPSMARAIAGFLIGVVIYRFHAGDGLKQLPSVRPEFVYSAWFFICAIPRLHAQPVLEAVAALVLAPIGIALLVRTERPLPRIYVRLGELSYPLYASHFAVITLASIWASQGMTRHSPAWALPMVLGALLIAWIVNVITNNRYWARAPIPAV